jgi:hypothetical protein
MAEGRQKIGRNISKHLRKKDIRELLTKDPHKAAKEAENRIAAEAIAEGLTHSNLHTACIMAVQPTTIPKIATSFWSRKRKWIKILHNLRINPHPEKSITLCNGLLTTSNIPNPTLCIFCHKPIKTTKSNL